MRLFLSQEQFTIHSKGCKPELWFQLMQLKFYVGTMINARGINHIETTDEKVIKEFNKEVNFEFEILAWVVIFHVDWKMKKLLLRW